MNQKGFTLLELLVVITVIAVFVTFSLVYLGESKDKGSDAGVKSNLLNARSLAEVYYTNNNKSYEGVCAISGIDTIGRLVQAAARAYGPTVKTSYGDSVASTWNTEECHDSASAYAVWVPFRASTSASPRGLCIDSNNVTKVATDVLPNDIYACP